MEARRLGWSAGAQALLVLVCAFALTPAQARSRVRSGGDDLGLRSSAVLVVDQETGQALISKNADVTMPIASLSKLMTAMVVLDARLPMDEQLEITDDDVDHKLHTTSRLVVGTRLARSDLLLLALMSSENRAALALSRNYPGGRRAFVARMNAKAKSLGMTQSQFVEPSGLSNENMSTARDLLRLVSAASSQPVIRDYTTRPEADMMVRNRQLTFVNTNRLVRGNRDWDIELQKTGFTNDAGRCLVMRATTVNRKLSMVFLNSVGTLTRFADAQRVRRQLQLEAAADRKAPKAASKAATGKPTKIATTSEAAS